MKIQCNVCEATEANVLCCADDAALCWACDEMVHAANKLASKHQRVPLSNSSSQMPKCDICQEASGFFFCLEDRALLCRKCDISIHTANSFVSAHQRFLLTGVKVGLETTDPGASSSVGKSPSEEKTSETKARQASRKSTPMQLASDYREVLPAEVSGMGQVVSTKVPFVGGSVARSIPQWHVDEFLGLPEFHENFGYMDNGSSKADSGKRGDSDSSSFLRAAEEEIGDDDCLGQVPETSWAMPQIPSPPTASGLYWPRGPQNQSDNAAFVPDISSFTTQKSHYFQRHGIVSKRRRQA
ncbi:B-box zinc finger protein 22 isoform X1 [Tripterygium wilfordii]|uniref:B-box zinc finger protein 22 isoform X1 n=1 Tax=Tripterygium wilfordii TaxID=458696 RepID=A0A7J7C1S7_TRIWF|nr:B-box zinc finger protein 22-like [Tripterygium wilfordii]KAF5728072.1 B-box zinc finger protein 22 isoform X1 [Tripterygium wilfordii]